jgi:hypothetical protein
MCVAVSALLLTRCGVADACQIASQVVHVLARSARSFHTHELDEVTFGQLEIVQVQAYVPIVAWRYSGA